MIKATSEILAFLVVALVLLLVTSAHGEEFARPKPETTTAEEYGRLYAEAYGRAGLGIPERPPRVYRVSREALAEMVCQTECGVRAAQFGDAVFLADDVDVRNAFDAGIVIHEMVHYVQRVRHGRASGCEQRMDREIHALQVQAEVLDRLGVSFPVPQLGACL